MGFSKKGIWVRLYKGDFYKKVTCSEIYIGDFCKSGINIMWVVSIYCLIAQNYFKMAQNLLEMAQKHAKKAQNHLVLAQNHPKMAQKPKVYNFDHLTPREIIKGNKKNRVIHPVLLLIFR
ncbi:hypothetical protein J7E63_06635 [Bacillus sp. ISL-75]|nr:hypothetical protein [Bacillus sp. ISL-75]